MAFLESVWQDLRYAVRSLRSKKLFTIIALSVLALGIGINTASFSILNGFALRPLPVKDPNNLVRIERHLKGLAADECCITYPDYRYYRENSSMFSSLVAYVDYSSPASAMKYMGVDQSRHWFMQHWFQVTTSLPSTGKGCGVSVSLFC
jgi:hypothetical protein